MSNRHWALVENPAWADKTPEGLERSACHDGSHFLTIACGCGEHMHIHESQTDEVPPHIGIASSCKACHQMLEFPPGYFPRAFRELRRRGWIR